MALRNLAIAPIAAPGTPTDHARRERVRDLAKRLRAGKATLAAGVTSNVFRRIEHGEAVAALTADMALELADLVAEAVDRLEGAAERAEKAARAAEEIRAAAEARLDRLDTLAKEVQGAAAPLQRRARLMAAAENMVARTEARVGEVEARLGEIERDADRRRAWLADMAGETNAPAETPAPADRTVGELAADLGTEGAGPVSVGANGLGRGRPADAELAGLGVALVADRDRAFWHHGARLRRETLVVDTTDAATADLIRSVATDDQVRAVLLDRLATHRARDRATEAAP